MISVPSGQNFNGADVDLVKAMATYGFIRYSATPFKLKSGILSHVYVFGREDLTDHPDLVALVGKKIASSVWQSRMENKQPCLIGLPMAGLVLAQAAAAASLDHRRRGDLPLICHRVMRQQLKQHGANQTWVDGKPDHDRHEYWLIDNVATDGATKIEAIPKLEQEGYRPHEMPALIFVDRQQGAKTRLLQAGFPAVVSCFNLLDLTYAMGELGEWPKDTVKAVEDEIQQHQQLS